MNIKGRLKALATRLGRPLDLIRALSDPVDELAALADRYGSDKGTAGHAYVRVYAQLFGPLRDRPIKLLEIGLLGYGGKWDDAERRDTGEAQGFDAPSLRMWADYFPQAQVFGLDFNDFSTVRIDRCRIFRGDMSRPDDLRSVLDAIGGKLDIIIDDASHVSHHQQIALAALFPALNPGGFYAIEDLTYQPADREPAGSLKTLDLLRRFEVTGEIASPHLSSDAAEYLKSHVAEVALFDSLASDDALSTRDNLGIIRKKIEAPE